MKLWLACAALAIILFIGTNAAIAQPASSPAQVITLSSRNPQGAMLTQVIHRRSTIEQVLADLAQLRATTPSPSCSANRAGDYRAVVTYADGTSTTLIADKGGCQQVVLQGRSRRVGADPRLLRDFDALFPPDWQTGF
jgi:type II secretory pathway component PulM